MGVPLYSRANAGLGRLKELLYVLDLKLKGARCPWSARIIGRVSEACVRNLAVGTKARIGVGVKFNMVGDGRIDIGEGAQIGSFVRLDAINGSLEIRQNTLINTHCIITAWSSVHIGKNTRIAPFCHITDRDHGLAKNMLIREQYGATSPIRIGRDVWIASSCIILMGVTVGDGAVIGANSVVNRDVAPYSIVAGSPARVIGQRS